MVAVLKDMTWIEDSSKIHYLGPLLNLLENQSRLVIATLNYDNCIELMSTSQEVDCQTGIGQWSEAGVLDVSSQGLHLIKLHGSIDWVRNEVSPNRERLPGVEIRKLTAEQIKEKAVTPAVIFGNRNKLTAEGPFLELLRVFKEELGRSQVLTVVGYSFGDSHINVYISQWLNGNDSRVLRIVNGPQFREKAMPRSGSSGFLADLLRFAAANDSRVKIIDADAETGLRQLYGERSGMLRQTAGTSTVPALDRMRQVMEDEKPERDQIDETLDESTDLQA